MFKVVLFKNNQCFRWISADLERKRYTNTTTNSRVKRINQKSCRGIYCTIEWPINHSRWRQLHDLNFFQKKTQDLHSLTTLNRAVSRFSTHACLQPVRLRLPDEGQPLLKRKNPCLCSGEHVWKDTQWSCRTLMMPGRPREKPPFFWAI